MQEVFEHEGKIFIQAGNEYMNCEGCAFRNKPLGCSDSEEVASCFENEIIWIEKK
jgi:hypothetical protein